MSAPHHRLRLAAAGPVVRLGMVFVPVVENPELAPSQG
jgi:hypothetical protein